MYTFKAPTKKKKKDEIVKSFQTNNSDDDNDDDDEEEIIITRKRIKNGKKSKKKMKSRKNSLLSFSHHDDNTANEEEEVEETTDMSDKLKVKSKKKQTKKKRLRGATTGGMGFGGSSAGGMIASHLKNDHYEEENETDHNHINSISIMTPVENRIHDDDEEDRISHDEKGDVSGDDSAVSMSLYGKEALARLKAQQQTFAPQSLGDNTNERPTPPPQHSDTTNRNNNVVSHSMRKFEQKNIPLPPFPSTSNAPKPPKTHLENNLDEDFIPLDQKSYSSSSSMKYNNIILTGDEALSYAGETIDTDNCGLNRTTVTKRNINKTTLGIEILNNFPKKKESLLEGINYHENNNGDYDKDDADVDEGERHWEAEISKRAGIASQGNGNHMRSTTQTSVPNNHHKHEKQIPTAENSKFVVDNVKNAIKLALNNLNDMELDVESNIGRRTHDQQVSKDDVDKKESEFIQIGETFEYYQNLRLDMVNWIGALRYISERVTIVEKAIVELYHDVGTNRERSWREWENDVIAILKERECLEYIVGRQPNPEIFSNMVEKSIDEFGRDVSILDSIDRKNRIKKRSRVRAESKDRRLGGQSFQKLVSSCEYVQSFEDSDLDVSDNELNDNEERRRVYSDAVSLVLSETDEQYSTLRNLLSLFQDWSLKHDDDYDQCYATLALVDLISVFVKVECCQNFDLICFIREKKVDELSLNSFKWYQALEEFDMRLGRSQKLTKIFAKKCGDFFLSMCNCSDESIGCYNLLSAKQTHSMTSFCKMMFAYVDIEDKSWRDNICSGIVQHINIFIQNLAIPILNHNVKIDDVDEIIKFATLGQLVRLRKIVYNVTKWYVLLTKHEKEELAKFCLMDVIAYRFLPILNVSTKILHQELKEEALNLFKDVWTCIKDMGWFKVSNLVLSSAPLRSVGTKYKCE